MRTLQLHTRLALSLCLLAGARLGAQNAQPPLDPHFENDWVILNAPHPAISIPGAATGKNWHNHPLNRVMVYVHTGGEKLTYQDGRVEDLKWEAGTVRWSPTSGYHYSEQPTWKIPPYSGPMLVDIGIKKAGNPGKAGGTALDPLKIDPQDFTLIFENDQVRVLRWKMGPRQNVPMHEYVLKHLVVYITDRNVVQTSPEGKVEVTHYKAGDTIWDGPSKYKAENLNDKPFEAVVVELKN
jgi:hypothetical protein